MKKLDIFLILVLFACFYHSRGQATLPVTRTAWGSTPTGWTDNGVNRTTVFACSGNDGGSMQASGKYYKVWFSGVPNQLTYKIKGSNPTTGTFKVQESIDGISWTDVVVFSTISGSTCLSQSNTLLSTSRYVQFIYTTKTSGNVDIDDVNITSTSLSEIQLQQPAGSDSACGFTYDFGSHSVNSNTDVTVRIENLGTTSLNISSYPITGTNSGEFTVVTPPTSPIIAGSYSDMTIRYTPLINGTKTAVLTINSDDGDESSCTINLLGTATYTSCSELIISEYGEPSSGNGKYIEIYNGTSASINLANYRLWKVNNGGTWPENTLNLSGTLAANATFLTANNSTDVPSANLYDATFCAWNGNDAVGLAKLIGATWMLVDAVGTDGVDPTPGWSVAGVTNATSNHTLVRKSTINIPNTDWASSSGTTSSNSEWIVKTYSLNNTGCNVSSCYTTTSVGFTVATDTITESNSTKTVYITMNTAPLSTVTANITDALLGTAAAGTDYSFTPTTLTFTPAESYPNTKSVTITIFDDAISESNENVILDVDAQCGALLNNNRYALTIKDNETPKGVIINEFTQGTGSKEYIELVVVGTPATTVDLRGWILDDNSGIFSGGYGTLLGIAPGHVKFSNICSWEKVPVGSIILLYNSSDKNPAITLADDPTDANLDYVYVVGIQSAGSCTSAAANLYFSSDCDIPNNSSFDVYTPPVYSNVDWNAMQFRNSGDAIQVRSNTGGFFHGLSYGSKGPGSDCSVCALNQTNHPDYPVYGTNALYFSGTNNITYAFLNTVDNDFRKLSNWSTTTSTPSALETPGAGNNANNIAWINSLRGNFDIVTTNQNYTCQLRQFESRFYLDAVDKIIFYIKNNANVDQGDLRAETYYYNSATAGRGFENDFISSSPTLFMEKTWIGTPTLTSGSTNYKIRFYVNNTELQNYCDYVNYKLDSFYSLAPGTSSYTPATIIPKLYLYRTGGSIRAWTAASSLQVEQVIPIYGAYGSYTYFEYNGFLEFSGYALGNEIVPTGIFNTLPVELTNFSGNCVDDNMVLLNWNTASEMNSKEFIVQHSTDGIHFTSIKNIRASGTSNSPRSYAAVDSTANSNENYYRLIEEDQNGKQNIQPMIFVKCSGVDAFQTYYNHEEGIIIQMNSAEEKEMQFNVYEISGKLIYHENKSIAKGTSKVTLNMRKNLADGIYIIQTVDVNHVAASKITVH